MSLNYLSVLGTDQIQRNVTTAQVQPSYASVKYS